MRRERPVMWTVNFPGWLPPVILALLVAAAVAIVCGLVFLVKTLASK
jgi:hypothetical protein